MRPIEPGTKRSKSNLNKVRILSFLRVPRIFFQLLFLIVYFSVSASLLVRKSSLVASSDRLPASQSFVTSGRRVSGCDVDVNVDHDDVDFEVSANCARTWKGNEPGNLARGATKDAHFSKPPDPHIMLVGITSMLNCLLYNNTLNRLY